MTDSLCLRLCPSTDRSRTELSLAVALPNTVSEGAMRQLIGGLAAWSGASVTIVLVVDARSSDWCDRWSQNLETVAQDAFEVRFELAPDEAAQ